MNFEFISKYSILNSKNSFLSQLFISVIQNWMTSQVLVNISRLSKSIV